MFCVKISADDAEFSFDKMTVVGLLFGIFVFMFHGLPYPETSCQGLFIKKISNSIICCTMLVVYVIWLYN